MVPSVPKLALGVGLAFRHVFKSLARARSQGAWQGHGPPGQCPSDAAPLAGHGWAWLGAMVPSVPKVGPRGWPCLLDMFLRVWLEPDLKEPGRGMDLQANAHRMSRPWSRMARHGWAPW